MNSHKQDDLMRDNFHLLGICFTKLIWRLRVLVEPFGLTGAQFGLLKSLEKFGPLSLSELSDKMVVTPGNLTGMVQRLVKLHLVERRRMQSDRRSLRVSLTPLGSEKIKEIEPSVRSSLGNLLNRMDCGDQELMKQLLTKLLSILQSE